VETRTRQHVLLFYYFIFLIVRRPWPNFVCKGRHTSSVVLVLVLVVETGLYSLIVGAQMRTALDAAAKQKEDCTIEKESVMLALCTVDAFH